MKESLRGRREYVLCSTYCIFLLMDIRSNCLFTIQMSIIWLFYKWKNWFIVNCWYWWYTYGTIYWFGEFENNSGTYVTFPSRHITLIYLVHWVTHDAREWNPIEGINNCAWFFYCIIDRCGRVCPHFYACKSSRHMSETARVTMITENPIVVFELSSLGIRYSWMANDAKKWIQGPIAWVSLRKISISHTWSTDVAMWKICTSLPQQIECGKVK